jgi:hypothetical protein
MQQDMPAVRALIAHRYSRPRNAGEVASAK